MIDAMSVDMFEGQAAAKVVGHSQLTDVPGSWFRCICGLPLSQGACHALINCMSNCQLRSDLRLLHD